MARVQWFDIVRIGIGLLFLLAAVLKGHQLAAEPVMGDGILASRVLLIALVEFELLFGLWLLAGICPRGTCRAALACFFTFAAVSAYKIIAGETSCGCFGRVPVSPWYALALDIAAMAALLWARPRAEPPGLLALAWNGFQRI